MTSADTSLLPCPFCGEQPKTNQNGVECCNPACPATRCHCIVPGNLDAAKRRWNSRASILIVCQGGVQ